MGEGWIGALARGLAAGQRQETAKRSASPTMLLAMLAAFVAVVALEVMLEDNQSAAAFLLIVPIGVVTLLYGSRMGLVAAAGTVAVAVGQAQLQDLAIGVAGHVTRIVVFLSVPVIVGIAMAREGSTPELEPAADPDTVARFNGRPGRLTKREVEILRLLALGYTNKEIAAQLYLSPRTVESHRANIQGKLRRSGRAELVRYALQHGLIGSTEQADSVAAAGRR